MGGLGRESSITDGCSTCRYHDDSVYSSHGRTSRRHKAGCARGCCFGGLAFCTKGRPRGTVGKASVSEARGPGFVPPWLVQRSRWESRPRTLVGNGVGAVTHPIERKGSVFSRGTGRFLVKKGVHIASFRCLSDETLSQLLRSD